MTWSPDGWWVSLASFIVGIAIPFVYGLTIALFKRVMTRPGISDWIVAARAFVALLLSYGVGSIALIYISAISRGKTASLIGLFFIAGLGLSRWWRGELR